MYQAFYANTNNCILIQIKQSLKTRKIKFFKEENLIKKRETQRDLN